MRMRQVVSMAKWGVVLMLLLAAIPVVAQVSGTILGVVKDASGGVVAGATVTVTNVENSQSRNATTSSDGAYRFSSMPVGHYTVKVEQAGFKTQTQQGLVLDVAQELVVNSTLEVGSAAQEVVVTGEAPLVNTTTSSLGGLVNEQRMAELPLNGRNYVDLSLMQAGVTQHANIGTSSGLAGTWFSSNGAPVISNYFTLDGAPIVNQFGGGGASFAGTTLGVDGIREYKVITNTFSAEYGMTMGSQVVMVSKGGSNQFHGDVFEFLRNSVLDARNYFDYGYLTPGAHRLPEFQRNNFGGAFGGPIRKDKTFFFGVYEGLRQNQGFTALDNVLNANCHGSAGTVVWNGTGTQPAGSVGPCTQLGANPSGTGTNSVTVGAGVAPLIGLYPNPSPGLPNQFTFGTTNTTSVNYGQMRVDHNFSDSDMFFVRYTIDNAVQNGSSPSNINAPSGVAFPQIRAQGQSRSQFLSLVETHIFSPSLLNSARISYARTTLISWNVYVNPALLTSPYSFVPGFAMGGLTVGGGALSPIGGSTTNGDPTHPTFHNQNLYTFGDDVSYTKGKQALKFGVLINRFGQAEQSQFNTIGAVTFNSIARFLAGTVDSLSSLTPGSDLNKYFMYTTLGFYGQDDWRVSSRLTVNLGLRYEFMTTPQELSGKQSRFLNIYTDSAASIGPVINNTTHKNFSPRVGFAWDVTGKGKTSVRGGAGLFFDVGNLGEYFDQEELTIPPYSSTSAVSFASTSITQLTLPITYPAGSVGGALHTTDYYFNSPHLLQYNLSVEQQLPAQIGLQVSYVGSRGWSLNSPNSNLNLILPSAVVNGVRYWNNNRVPCQNVTGAGSCRINPNWTAITLQTTDALSWYNSLQVVLNRRLSKGLQFQSAYTYAQALDTGTGALVSAQCSSSGADSGINPENRILDKGPTCFDVRQNWRFNLIYHFPNLKSNGFASKMVNGWWMGNIVSVQSGYAFTPIITTARSNSGQANHASVGNAAQAATYTCTPGALVLYKQPVCDATGHITLNYIPFDNSTVVQSDPNQWFNPLMFMLAPAITCPGTTADICQTTGSTSRDMLRGPGMRTWDFSLVKDTALRFLGESGSLQFRAEFFNVLNHANFAMPNGTVFNGKNTSISSYAELPNSAAGQITATRGTSRQIQLALKVVF